MPWLELLILLMVLLLGGTVWFALARGTAEGEQRDLPRLRDPKP